MVAEHNEAIMGLHILAMASGELLEWCRTNGIVWDGIESGYVADGWRGVLATEDLEADTCILQVPQHLLLTVRSAWRDPQLHDVLEAAGRHLSSGQVLAVHLLHEVSKGERSFWWPYLRSLPRSYTTAMCFRPAEVEALQVPYAQAAVEEAVERTLTQWREALPVLRALGLTPKWLSKQAWLWAASTLSSRTMYVPFDPAGALTPFGDLHNYAPPPPPYTPRLLPATPTQPVPPPQLAVLTQRYNSGPAANPSQHQPLEGSLACLSPAQRARGASAQDATFQHLQQLRTAEGEGHAGSWAGEKAPATQRQVPRASLEEGLVAVQPSLRQEGTQQSLPQDRSWAEEPRQQLQQQRQQQLHGALRIHRPRAAFQRQPPSPPAEAHTSGTAAAPGRCCGVPGWADTHAIADHGALRPCAASLTAGLTAGLQQRPLGHAPVSPLFGMAPAGRLPAEPSLQQSGAMQVLEPGSEGGPEGADQQQLPHEEQQEQQWRGQKEPKTEQEEQQQAQQGKLEQLCGDGCLDEQNGEYRIYTRRRYQAGEQVFLCYGRHTNLELLEHYGFVLPNNPHDVAVLPHHILPSEAAAQLAGPPLEGCYAHCNGAPAWELLRALRLAAATPAERRSGAYLALDDKPISSAGEVRALGMLCASCTGALRALPTTAEQDMELLAEQRDTMSGCLRLAVEWRLGYKRILQRCLELCEEALALSSS